MPTVTEAIVERLKKAGVRHIFGVPGGECNLDFIAAAEKFGIRFILTRNETAAAFMACTVGELTGTIGIAMTTRGPGLAAAANGVSYAFLDRAALLLIADGYDDDQTFVSHQRMDQDAMLKPVVKGSSLLRGADPLLEVERLLEAATTQPPGPVYLETAGPQIRRPAPPTAATPNRPQRAAPSEAALNAARDLLAKSKRPIVLAGLQASAPEASAALRKFVAETGAPVLTTYKAKGTVSEHSLHMLGHYIGGVAEEPAVRAADLVVLYGFDAVEGPPQKWRHGALPSVEFTEHDFTHPLFTPSVSVVGDIAHILNRVGSAVARGGWGESELRALKERLSTAARVAPGKGISPQQVVDAAAAAFPSDCRITIDAGAHMLPVLHLWRSQEPRQALISRGLATMGFALPAAIASCIAEPQRRAIAFTGDGGLMMCLGELGTAFQERCKPIVVVFNDSSLTLISAKQRRRQLATAGVDFYSTDFAQVARGFGWSAHHVSNAADLAPAFASAISDGRPTLIDVVVDPEEYDAQILALRG